MKPSQIPLEKFMDERGILFFDNSLSLVSWRRLYFLENSSSALSRGWHGHRTEKKCFIAVNGKFQVEIVCIDDSTQEPHKVKSFEMDAAAPTALYVPPMHANKITADSESARMLVLSSQELSESINDIIRFPLETWS